MAKLPTRSPTHADIEMSRLASMGSDLDDISTPPPDDAGDGAQGTVELTALVELAEDRGRPPSHYLAAVALASELRVVPEAALVVKACAGTCQRYGALDLMDHLVERYQSDTERRFQIHPVSCLDRCDQAPACEVVGAHGTLVLAPATKSSLDEALDTLGSIG